MSHSSVRALLVGSCIGVIFCFSNMYFGLQTGWVTMGSLQAALLGYAASKILQRLSTTSTAFSKEENVFIQTVSVAVASLPLTAGFVGIIPALAIYGQPIELNFGQFILWSIALGFFGVFFAVPLRTQTIVKEKLAFPSGTATARLIELLHASRQNEESKESEVESTIDYSYQWKVLGISFLVSAIVSLLGFFFPSFAELKIFSWIGMSFMTEYLWTFQLSFGYIGQGMIMGMRSAVSMFIGSVLGFGILSPIARTSGWASGPVDDWKKGAKGWILWISLAMMTSECISSSFVLIYDSFNLKSFNFRKLFPKKNVAENEGLILNSDSDNSTDEKPELETLPNHFLIPRKWWIGGLVISSFLCILIISLMFNQMFYEPLLALIFALVVSLLAVRALGETDLNPVSGIGKISQIFFGVISPNNVVGNIIAGAISEAGAQQAGDLMQAFKTGYLLNASPRAQFYGTISGTFVSILFSIIAYKLYVSAYGVPSSTLPAPTAQVWVDMAEFMSGGSLAQNVLPFCIVFALVAAALPILPKFISESRRVWIPSGVAMAVGMYVTPNWTLARLVGAIGQYIWKRRNPVSHGAYMVIIASGFVLGEGVMSIFTALLKNWGVNS